MARVLQLIKIEFVQEGLTCTSQRDLPWINAMIIQPYFKSGTCMTPFNLHFITINNKAIIIYKQMALLEQTVY